MYRLEIYKLWLGFLEKAILLLFATLVVPLVAGKIILSGLTGMVWFIIGVVLIAAYGILSSEAKKLADALDVERKGQ